VQPAQSVPHVDPVQIQTVSRIQDMEVEMQRLREMIERAQAAGGNDQTVRNLQDRVAFIERQLGIETASSQRPPAPRAAQAGPAGPEAMASAQPQQPVFPPQEARHPAGGAPVPPNAPVDLRSAPLPPDEQLYREAYGAYKSGNMDQAVALFEDLLRKFPKSTFASDAVYWSGESRFAQGRYDEAVLMYDRVLKEFPGSKKELNALLKQGQAFEKMGDPKSARIIFQKIVTEHPHTVQARLASNKMKSLPQ
jgi:tol-pal system protein YbgF